MDDCSEENDVQLRECVSEYSKRRTKAMSEQIEEGTTGSTK